ncbi:MAG TPA: cbb3-type cytochrome c oxidase subunit II [Chitinophagaceae bacterium]
MQFFDDHRKLFTAALALFLFLTLMVAILPAIYNQEANRPLPNAEPLSAEAAKGKLVYIENGCVACHTQQVRNIEMDKQWGDRPGVPADYAATLRTDLWRNTATLMGTERTGPDLVNVGKRQPGKEWHLLHLYNPRLVVKESIMPAYPWLFTVKKTPAPGDVIVNVPEGTLKPGEKLVATAKAMQLVAYLQSLKQTPLPDGSPAPAFIQSRKAKKETAGTSEPGLDGAALYAANCQSCHQATGEGLPGAFPPLKGSKVVLDDNPELMLSIILNGYNSRASQGFPSMPPIGTNNNLTPEEITAIMNHEKTSWGNNARKVTAEEISKLFNVIQSANAKK